MVSVAVTGTVVLGFLVFKRRRTPGRGTGFARPLLLCISLLLATIVVEAVSAIWQFRLHRSTAVPIGGLPLKASSVPTARFPAPVDEFVLPTDFPDPPGEYDIDLVVVGESSAEGVPYSNWLSLGSILKWKLSEALPGRRIRPRVVARSGDTLEWQHRELERLARRPDLLIVYSGHNEFTSRLAASRDPEYYFDESLPTARDLFVHRLEQSSFLCG
jgi:hypothetical protein